MTMTATFGLSRLRTQKAYFPIRGIRDLLSFGGGGSGVRSSAGFDLAVQDVVSCGQICVLGLKIADLVLKSNAVLTCRVLTCRVYSGLHVVGGCAGGFIASGEVL